MRKQTLMQWLSGLVMGVLLLAACSPTPTPTAPAANAAPTEKPFRVGLVTDVGKIDDRGFLQASWEGVQLAGTELGAEVQYIQTVDPKDYAKNIEQFAEAGYDVIVVPGFGIAEATLEAAKKYPDIKFIGIAHTYPEDPPANLVSLGHPEDQGGFLAGALAAQMTKTGHVATIFPTDAVPPVWRYGEGFRAGALHINPDIQVTVVYHNDVGFDKTFNDAEWGKTTAIALADQGVDVIFAGASDTGNGALLGAAQMGVMAIGADVDAYHILPEAAPVLLSSALKLIKTDTFELIKGAKEGRWQSGYVNGLVGLAPYHDWDSQVPEEVKARMEQIVEDLRSGALETGVLLTKPSG